MPTRIVSPITARQAAAAVDRVIERRRRVEGDSEKFSQVSDDPMELAAYVLDHPTGPPEDLIDDIEHCLRALGYTRRLMVVPEMNRLEYELLRLARAKGASYARLCRALDLRSAQAVQQRIDRHWAASQGLIRRDGIARQARAWLARKAPRMRRAVAELTRAGHLEGADPEDVADLAAALAAVEPGGHDEWRQMAPVAARARLLLAEVDVPDRLRGAAGEIRELADDYDRIATGQGPG